MFKSLLFFALSFSFCLEAAIFVHLKTNSHEMRTAFASEFHIDSLVEDSVYAVVNDSEFAVIKQRFSNFLVDSHVMPVKKTLKFNADFPQEDEKYHTYKEMVSKLKNLVKNNSDIAQLISIGKTKEARDIWLVKISQDLVENKLPGAFFVGGHHAREHLSSEIPLGALAHILKNRNDGKIKSLIASRELYILPSLNPDGAMFDIKDGAYQYWRKNRSHNKDGSRGVDLNRNYDHEWSGPGSSSSPRSGTYHGPHAFSEAESKAIKKFVEEHPLIRTMVSYHTFSELVLYPWSGRREGVGGQEQLLFEKMAEKISQSTGYSFKQSSSMYISTGDTCDWAYEAHGVYCFTVELSPKGRWNGGFYPGDIIESTLNKNLKSIFYLWDLAGNPTKELYPLKF